ncbi:MAG: SUMF1/EgtB/PvdO family nonheme iron enzyme [Elusimicrobia bacterium]|nr:SUMF1/EgtB/PvdO family nonheme iron enzyme [Elusimicrobiota bacterium]
MQIKSAVTGKIISKWRADCRLFPGHISGNITGFPILSIETIKSYCQAGKAIFLIDGLDEIEPIKRSLVVNSLADFRLQYKCAKMVLSGRPHSIDTTAIDRFGDKHIKIHQLNPEQVDGFINNWFKHIYGFKSQQGKKTAFDMIGEINSHPRVAQLIDTPLMLTAVCILYHEERELPGQRAELYKKIIDNLLYRFSYRIFKENELLKDQEKVVEFLMTMAFVMQKNRVKGIDKRAAVDILGRVFPQKAEEDKFPYRRKLEKTFDHIEANCGLLKFDDGQYSFWHLTFQEFLCARYIVDHETDYVAAVKDYWSNEWYNEVLELYIGYLSIDNKKWANKLVETQLSSFDAPPFNRWRLASKSLQDIPRSRREPQVIELAQTRLQEIFKSKAEAKVWADAGEILGWLGDPRNLEEFVTIRGGKYKLEGLGEVEIKPFEISQYPVTNSWYKKFIDQGRGYETPAYWSEEGRKWLESARAKCPRFCYDRQWNCPNAPVVGVCWYEADAFCHWLTETQRDGYKYQLPTEQEWQAAAAGKIGRKYSWDEWENKRCNTSETEIGKTSAVGIFLEGCTPEEVYDLSGNVWEWTQTDYKTKLNQWDFIFDREVQELLAQGKLSEAYRLSEKREGNLPVLRSGSWYLNQVYARCAYRFRNDPGSRYVGVGFRCVRTKK